MKSVMMAGNQGQGQYWGRPYFGYYRSDDEWILRKHATQLCNAGIDFIYLDASNNYNYPHISSRIFEVWQQMRNEGLDTPQIAYFMGADTAFSTKQIMDVYYYIYRDNKFSDLWFKWEGKPLILGDRNAEVPQEIKNLFSFRYCWAFDSQKRPDFKDYWPWGQNYPQKPGKSPTGEIEQMTVMCGGWASSSDGRSFAGGKLPDEAGGEDFEFDLKTSAQGLMYDEHWAEALKVDPKVVMLCGWNEWIAGRCVSQSSAEDNWFANTYMVDHTDPVKSSYFLDNFNLEFSRDLEPMTGGYKDNYYYQTVQNIRKFKGVRPQPAAYGEREIEINGDFAQWDGVGPVYRDTKGDTTHRNSTANAGSDVYVNNSGRNDITDAKAMLNGGRAYFYVKTNDEITPPSGTNWMNLFIDADNNAQTGWQGYDFVINRAQDGGKAKIERFATSGWQTEEVGWADLFYENNQLHLGADAGASGP